MQHDSAVQAHTQFRLRSPTATAEQLNLSQIAQYHANRASATAKQAVSLAAASKEQLSGVALCLAAYEQNLLKVRIAIVRVINRRKQAVTHTGTSGVLWSYPKHLLF